MDHLLECEVDPTVEAFCEQPIRIQYKHQGVRRSYTPDLLIFDRTPPHEIREVKPERKAAEPENERRWPAIGEALNSLGFSFQVYTERHLRIRKATVRAIFRDRHAPLPSPEVLAAIEVGLGQDSVTIGEACARFSLTRQQVHALIRKLFFQLADFDAPLGPDCPIRLGPGLTRWSGRNQYLDI
ncbi:TnsA endonuclease N-terminal domain-containing protein [Pseudaminobacter soli (ex Li et al. 2025)]|nr:TnsA endonuclease N-terminal domain-containing protein [Mesorhizobium soli]